MEKSKHGSVTRSNTSGNLPTNLLLTYKALIDQVPSYLKDLIVRYFPMEHLCSQTAGLLMVPRVSKSKTGGRALPRIGFV